MIVAIDPGNEMSAYVVWDNEVVEMGMFPNHAVATALIDFALHKKGQCVIEMIESYGMPVGKSVFETCVWIGRFAQLWEFYSPTEAVLIPRGEVKLHFCQTRRAKDSNIRQALIDRYEPNLKPRQRPQGMLKGVTKDLWQALALGVYFSDTQAK